MSGYEALLQQNTALQAQVQKLATELRHRDEQRAAEQAQARDVQDQRVGRLQLELTRKQGELEEAAREIQTLRARMKRLAEKVDGKPAGGKSPSPTAEVDGGQLAALTTAKERIKQLEEEAKQSAHRYESLRVAYGRAQQDTAALHAAQAEAAKCREGLAVEQEHVRRLQARCQDLTDQLRVAPLSQPTPAEHAPIQPAAQEATQQPGPLRAAEAKVAELEREVAALRARAKQQELEQGRRQQLQEEALSTSRREAETHRVECQNLRLKVRELQQQVELGQGGRQEGSGASAASLVNQGTDAEAEVAALRATVEELRAKLQQGDSLNDAQGGEVHKLRQAVQQLRAQLEEEQHRLMIRPVAADAECQTEPSAAEEPSQLVGIGDSWEAAQRRMRQLEERQRLQSTQLVAQAERVAELQAHVLQVQAGQRDHLQATLWPPADRTLAVAAPPAVPEAVPDVPQAAPSSPGGLANVPAPPARRSKPPPAPPPAPTPAAKRQAPPTAPASTESQSKPQAPGAQRKAAKAAVAKLMAPARPARPTKGTPAVAVKRDRDEADSEAQPPAKAAKPAPGPSPSPSVVSPAPSLPTPAPKEAAPQPPASGEPASPAFTRLLAAYVAGTTSMSQSQVLAQVDRLCPDLKVLVGCLGTYLFQAFRALAPGQQQRLLDLVSALHRDRPNVLPVLQNVIVADAKECCGGKYDARKPQRLAVLLQFLAAWLVATRQEGALAVLVFDLVALHIPAATSTDSNITRLLALLALVAEQCPGAIHRTGSLLAVAYHVVLADVVRARGADAVQRAYVRLMSVLELPPAPAVDSKRLLERCLDVVLACPGWEDPLAVQQAAEAVRALHLLALHLGFVNTWETLARNGRLLAHLQAERKRLDASKLAGKFGSSPADTPNVAQALYVSLMLALSKASLLPGAPEDEKATVSQRFIRHWFLTVLKEPADFPLFGQLDAARGLATLQQRLSTAELLTDPGAQALRQWGQALKAKVCCTPALAADPVLPYQLRALLRTLDLHLPATPPP